MGDETVQLVKLILLIWFWFGILTILGFLWLGRKGVQALMDKETSTERHKKAVVSAKAA